MTEDVYQEEAFEIHVARQVSNLNANNYHMVSHLLHSVGGVFPRLFARENGGGGAHVFVCVLCVHARDLCCPRSDRSPHPSSVTLQAGITMPLDPDDQSHAMRQTSDDIPGRIVSSRGSYVGGGRRPSIREGRQSYV